VIPTREEGTKHERFAAFRKGWRDGACSKARDRRFTEHATRPDLTEQYERGYGAGRDTLLCVLAREAERLGYDPAMSILRAKDKEAGP
jgi:hypothetical protein